MRYLTLLIALMLSTLFIGTTFAGEDSEETDGERPDRSELREKMLKEFDADGDGKLSDDERATAREQKRGKRGKKSAEGRGKKGREKKDSGEKGARGKGKGGKGRGPQGHGPPDPNELFEKFDANGDDQLSRDEFQKLSDAMRALHERRHGHGEGRRGDHGKPPEGRGDRRGPPPAGEREFRRPKPLENPGEATGPHKEGRSGRKGPSDRGSRGRDGFRPPEPGELFNRFDRNEDEQLSREEFMELSRAVREHMERIRGNRDGHGEFGPPRERGREGRPPGRDRPRPPRHDSDDATGFEPASADESSV